MKSKVTISSWVTMWNQYVEKYCTVCIDSMRLLAVELETVAPPMVVVTTELTMDPSSSHVNSPPIENPSTSTADSIIIAVDQETKLAELATKYRALHHVSSGFDEQSLERRALGEQWHPINRNLSHMLEILNRNLKCMEAWRLWKDTSDPAYEAKASEAMETMEESTSPLATATPVPVPLWSPKKKKSLVSSILLHRRLESLPSLLRLRG
ncbi:unnamed protein product [Linum trigynum]|uniref:Uncharacterized protein n=1 Tax=Linum trigynum TaxID=586398 RepID=A0AAV2GR46_9ROSI